MSIRARIRLMKWRWYRRRADGAVLAGVLSTFMTLIVWGGYRGYRSGWLDPIPISEALGVFPRMAACVFVSYVFWPWRHWGE